MSFFWIFILVLGYVIGSFLGALTYRLPRGISIKKGRSFCPNCKAKISWYDNIPVLSYLVLGGRCRSCKAKISLRYLLIEISTAVIFVGIYLQGGSLYVQGASLVVLPYLLAITSLLIIIFVIDLEHKIIPDEAVFWGLGMTILALFISSSGGLYLHLFSGFCAALFLLAVHLLTKGRGMGLGDVKFSLWGGLFFGWPLTIIWLLISFVIGAVVGLVLILIGKAHLGKEIPFGPFLAISFFITLVWGNVFLLLLGI
jgi:leader peptidase (prepilin peptidase)/N-methyltransferase